LRETLSNTFENSKSCGINRFPTSVSYEVKRTLARFVSVDSDLFPRNMVILFL
jgi:hypothetical protein